MGWSTACSTIGMPYVITELCAGTCDASCISVCPVDCIHGPRSLAQLDAMSPEKRRLEVASMQLYIDPESCICCGACAPECPVDAIFDEDDVPSGSRASIEENAAFFRAQRRESARE